MIRFFLAVLLALTSAGVAPRATAETPLQVLFIGNSYTYFNNLPEMLERLSEAPSSPRPLRATMIAEGGATLQHHWEGGKAVEAIRRGGWDYVVLQEQSTLGMTFLVNGSMRITDSPSFRRHARLFDDEIRKVGARTLLFLTWARKGMEEREQNALTYAYASLGREMKSVVAPAGIAWQSARKAKPELELYVDDGSHPAPAGSYLAACVLYATIYDRTPVGLPSRLAGHRVDDEGVVAKGDAVLADLADADARVIQAEAWRAREETRAAGGYPPASEPPPPALPAPPAGRRPTLAALEGVWVGSFAFYPVPWPATMELRLKGAGEALQGALKITFAGNADADKSPAISGVRMTDTGIAFEDSTGINGAPVRYVGSYTDGRLEGTAEVKVPNQPVYAIGTWKLERR
jgi:hypothetical protein